MLATLALAFVPQVWTVSPTGPADFLDLPAAVAAAAPGDTIMLAPGAYTPTTIDKPLVVAGWIPAGGSALDVTVLTDPSAPLIVKDTADVTLANFLCDDLVLDNVTGRLRIDKLEGDACAIVDCTDVVMRDSKWRHSDNGVGAVTIEESTVVLEECDVQNMEWPEYGGSALRTFGDSRLTIIGGMYIGASVSFTYPSEKAGHAILAKDGTLDLVVRGSSDTYFVSGINWHSFEALLIGKDNALVNLTWSGAGSNLGVVNKVDPAEPYLAMSLTNYDQPVRRLRAFGPAGAPCFVVFTAGSSTLQPTPFAGDPIRVDLTQIYGHKLLTLQGQDTPANFSAPLPLGPSAWGLAIDIQGVVTMPNTDLFVTNATQTVLVW